MAEKIIKDVGLVTAYGYAVSKGYTGTEEEFAEALANAGVTLESITDAVNTFLNTTVPNAVQSVTDEGTTQVANVNAAGAAQVQAVNSAGTTQIDVVNSTGTTQVTNVNNAGTDKVAAVNAAGNTQVSNVNTAGSAKVAEVEQKGEEVLDSIPADYTELVDEVSELKTDLYETIDDLIPINDYGNLYSNKMTGVRTQASGSQLAFSGTIANPNTNYLTARIPVSPNTAYTVTFSELTDYAVLVTGSNEIETEDFTRSNPINISNYSVISSTRQKVYNFTTDANAQYLYICSTIEGNTDAYIYVTQGTITEPVIAKSWVKFLDAYNKAQIDSIVAPVMERTSAVVFNGSSSECAVDPITLSQNGDSLEIEIMPNDSSTNSGYSFASNSSKANISIGASTTGFGVRSADRTWLYVGMNIWDSNPKYKYVLKILYDNGNIKFYVDGELISTYSGLKTITITGFGKNNSYSYWNGSIGYIEINGTRYRNISELGGYSGTSVSVVYPYGWLTEEQFNSIVASTNEFRIVPTSTKVSVYFRIVGNVFGRIDITHEVDHSDDPYIDYWRIADSYICTSNDGETFTTQSYKLLVGAENEMAVAFQGMGDFTGGWHGDERIDLANECYCVFIVDGEEYSIDDLVSLGTFDCETFAYREVSKLYASYSYNSAHLPIANHTKITTFGDKGFKTKNYVGMDLSGFNANSLNIITSFTGLFCVHKMFANYAVSDVGAIYTASHPTTTAPLAEEMNKYDLTAKTYNGRYSCEIDSKLINTSISAFKNAPVDVDMMDRQNDLKYYSYLPEGVSVETGDYFATEASIMWNIKQ